MQQGLKGLKLLCSVIFKKTKQNKKKAISFMSRDKFIFWAFFGTQGGAFSLRHFL